jgi:hypothetical protein
MFPPMFPKPFLLFCVVLPSFGVFAQESKVDINNTGRPLSEGLDPSFVAWSTNASWFTGGDVISNRFNGVTVSFRRVGDVGSALLPGYWKDGVQNVAYNAKLSGDGIKVNGGDSGARIEMRLSGLTPGPHSLLSYHSAWDNLAAGTGPRLNVFVGGIQAVTNLATSVRVTNSADSATAYLGLEAVEGEDVVVLFQANTAIPAANYNVYINGFEIDTADSTLKAVKPAPANRDEHVDGDSKSLLLHWTGAGGAVSHDVYFGMDSNAVKSATRASSLFLGTQSDTSRWVTNLSSRAEYFWRVDEIAGGGVATKGDVWMFRPRRLAFPGAEGYGRFARGGRGGVVVEVDTLNDSGPGSLRDALTGNHGPRTVVFNVSGLITLESDLIINGLNPNITLAGQTAPGKGIAVRKSQLGVSGGRDLIIRHVRSRPGNLSGRTLNGSGLAGSDHCIMDHVSISWGIDEELSTRGSRNVTFQRSLIAEALNIAGHQNYPAGTAHGYAASVGGDVASLHHNLLAHNEGRNWSMAGGLDGAGHFAGRLDIFNNVVYNWGHRTTDGGAHEVNFVGNYYKTGAATSYFYALNAQYGNFPGTQQYYFAGNVMPGRFGLGNQTAGRTTSTENGGSVPTSYEPFVNAPFFPSHATIHTAANAYKQVLSDVGCNQPGIDDHDVRVIRETIDGTYTYTGTGPYGGKPGLPNSQDDVGGWEDYGTAVRPPDWDTDHDGLPNWWERIHGLDPNSPAGDFSDSNGDPDGDEFTNLEDYLNWMAAPHFDATNGMPLELDLTRFARGFTNNNPVFAVGNATNGGVSLVGGRLARFMPSATGEALGSFRFTVTDAVGDSMTHMIGLRIVAAAQPAPAPMLGIRREGGATMLEVTAPAGQPVSVWTNASPGGAWLNWTGFTANGALQLVPLDGVSGRTSLWFRATSP